LNQIFRKLEPLSFPETVRIQLLFSETDN